MSITDLWEDPRHSEMSELSPDINPRTLKQLKRELRQIENKTRFIKLKTSVIDGKNKRIQWRINQENNLKKAYADPKTRKKLSVFMVWVSCLTLQFHRPDLQPLMFTPQAQLEDHGPTRRDREKREEPDTHGHQDRVAEAGQLYSGLQDDDGDPDHILVIPGPKLQEVDSRIKGLISSVSLSGVTPQLASELRDLLKVRLSLVRGLTVGLAEYRGALKLRELEEAREAEELDPEDFEEEDQE